MTAARLADRFFADITQGRAVPKLAHSVVLSDLFARAAVGALFTLLSINIFEDFMRTGRVTGPAAGITN